MNPIIFQSEINVIRYILLYILLYIYINICYRCLSRMYVPLDTGCMWTWLVWTYREQQGLYMFFRQFLSLPLLPVQHNSNTFQHLEATVITPTAGPRQLHWQTAILEISVQGLWLVYFPTNNPYEQRCIKW